MSLFIESIFALIVTINPIGVISPYLSITEEFSEDKKRKILFAAIKFATIVLITCLFIGGLILDIFGVSTFSLKIAGGILFFKFGYDTINGTRLGEKDKQENPGFVPLGFPIIAGPGSITAVILLSSEMTHQIQLSVFIILAILLIMLLTLAILLHSSKIIKVLGNDATNAIIKIMGLLVITVGVQLILSGISEWLLLNS